MKQSELDKIREAFQKNMVKQAAIARKIGLSGQAISQYLKGKQGLRREHLEQLKVLLGIEEEVEDVLNENKVSYKKNGIDKEMYERMLNEKRENELFYQDQVNKFQDQINKLTELLKIKLWKQEEQ